MLKCCDLLIERMCHIFLHTYKIAYLSLMYFQTVFLFGKPKLLPDHFSIMFFSFLWKKFHLFYMFWLMVNYLRYNQIIGSISWFPPICILTGFNFSGRVIHSEAALAAKISQILVDRCSIRHPKRQSGRYFSRVLQSMVCKVCFFCVHFQVTFIYAP